MCIAPHATAAARENNLPASLILPFLGKLLYPLPSLWRMNNLPSWRKAGRIAAESMAYGAGLIRKGASLLEVTEKTEAKIAALGGRPAFPVQISCNHLAAHYCATSDDPLAFTDQLVSLDVGVHVDGCIGDTAVTIDLSGNQGKLVQASRAALENAIQGFRQQKNLGEIGRIIQDTIQGLGFAPVRNLSGHGLQPFQVHTPPTIPNYDNGDETVLQDMIFAVEPFASTGMGVIHEAGEATIFSLDRKKPVRSPMTRKILQQIESYQGLPFCTRWLEQRFPQGYVALALREMRNLEMLTAYPPLPDMGKGMVSQAEHTLYIDADGKVEVLTALR